ncbi:MAG: response regulator transcription factor [Chloroflexaceae bacterium]|jgi:DNA-binding NarL/FixJ family response regulator|nr:response regulator transcription factor [Chloroflexaceae bacterium]
MSDPQAAPPIRILVADDHPVVRDGLVAMLRTQPDFQVVAEAGDGRSAVEAAARTRPDLLLLDLEMPGLDGLGALQQLHAADPTLRVLVFTAFADDERVIRAVQSGVKGYVLKGAPRDELFHAIRVVSRGGSLLQPLIAARMLTRLRNDEALTERELAVLRLLARGLANKQIASELSITERTVKFHISAILSKLAAANRTDAVRIAVQRGLITLDGQV